MGCVCIVILFGLLPAVAGSWLYGDQGLLGQWDMTAQDRTIALELRADGQGILGGQSFTYQIQGNRITVTYPDGSGETLVFQLQGETLRLTMDDGNVLLFRRRGSPPTSAAAGDSGGFMTPGQPDPGRPSGKNGPDFARYTLQSDRSVQVGYPRGWTVQEEGGTVVMAESAAPDAAGLIVLVGQLQDGLGTREQLAERVLDSLRQNAYPDLEVVRQAAHPRSPEILTIHTRFTGDGIPFQALCWCLTNPGAGIGIFSTFYAPATRFGQFDADEMIYGCLAPMMRLGTAGVQTAAASPSGGSSSSAAGQTVRYIRFDGDSTAWCGLDIAGGGSQTIQSFPGSQVTGPAVWQDGQIVIFAVRDPSNPRLMGTVRGQPFQLKLPPGKEISVRHPTISRDGRLLAFTIKSHKHVGNVDVHDAASGAYDSTFMAVGTWFKIVAVEMATGRQKVVYYDDPIVTDVMKNRGLGPVYSPTEDILVYANSHRLHVCESETGREIHTWPAPQISHGGWTGQALVSEISGLAFSPDGRTVAYLSQGEADLSNSPHLLVLMDVHSGQSRYYAFPQGLSGWTPLDIVCLDFSPDGKHIVFSGTIHAPDVFLCLLNLADGSVNRLNAPGRCLDPVWKGR